MYHEVSRTAWLPRQSDERHGSLNGSKGANAHPRDERPREKVHCNQGKPAKSENHLLLVLLYYYYYYCRAIHIIIMSSRGIHWAFRTLFISRNDAESLMVCTLLIETAALGSHRVWSVHVENTRESSALLVVCIFFLEHAGIFDSCAAPLQTTEPMEVRVRWRRIHQSWSDRALGFGARDRGCEAAVQDRGVQQPGRYNKEHRWEEQADGQGSAVPQEGGHLEIVLFLYFSALSIRFYYLIVGKVRKQPRYPILDVPGTASTSHDILPPMSWRVLCTIMIWQEW